MAIAKSVKESWTHVLEEDRQLPESEQTKFELRRLTTVQLTKLKDLVQQSGGGEVTMRFGTFLLAAVQVGLVGWSNFRDAQGVEVPFTADRGVRRVEGILVESPAALESLNRLQAEHLQELANALIAGNELTRAEAKN